MKRKGQDILYGVSYFGGALLHIINQHSYAKFFQEDLSPDCNSVSWQTVVHVSTASHQTRREI